MFNYNFVGYLIFLEEENVWSLKEEEKRVEDFFVLEKQNIGFRRHIASIVQCHLKDFATHLIAKVFFRNAQSSIKFFHGNYPLNGSNFHESAVCAN